MKATTSDQLIYVSDSSNIEARMLAWLAGHNVLVNAFRNKEDAYSLFASKLFGRLITKADTLERFIGKVCIAEGSLVLTDTGLKPIELISTADRVWDGLSWVNHDGVVYQGYKEVITYDGLTATPDHKVYAEGYRHPVQLRNAASTMGRLVRSGIGRHSIRVSDGCLPAYSAQGRVPNGASPMQQLPHGEVDQPGQSQEGQDAWVPKLLAETIELVHRAWETLRCLDSAMQYADERGLSALRGARDHLHLCIEGGIHTLRGAAIAAYGLPGDGDRPDRQRRALFAGESATGNSGTELPKQGEQHIHPVAGANDPSGRAPFTTQLSADISVRKTGHDGGADHRAGVAVGPREAQRLAGARTKAHVYDILNAGPNRRFTVSDKLVANCVLGLGYGMGWRKFMDTLAVGALGGPPVYFTEEESRNAVNLYRSDNAPIVAYWAMADQAITDMHLGNTRQWGPLTIQKNCLVMPNGMALQYPGLRIQVLKEGEEVGPFGLGYEYWNGKFWKKLYGGLLVENITQAMSRIVLFTQMLDMNKTVFVPVNGRVVLNVHDEAIGIGPSYGAIKTPELDEKGDNIWINAEGADELFARMSAVMRTPPAWCLDLPLGSEGGFDTSYSK